VTEFTPQPGYFDKLFEPGGHVAAGGEADHDVSVRMTRLD
jgi:hypothetical protein